MKLQKLLELLADGRFHSGSELGASLGVSRTAVWKSLSQLDGLGLSCESVKGKGYRLPYSIDLLSKDEIFDHLDESLSDTLSLSVLMQIDSTNAYLMRQSGSQFNYDICLAEQQTAGRGRRGRTWVSPFGRNIYMSIAFDLTGGVDVLNGLSLVVGLGVVRALKDVGVSDAKLKWPNDVWVDDKKICGILVELQGEATTSWRVVVGIGLNVSMASDDAGVEEIEQEWTSVLQYSGAGRNVVAASLLSNLYDVFESFKQDGFKGFITEWDEYDALKGRDVNLNAGVLHGVARGVDLQGALLLELSSGELKLVNAGEVSVRCR